MNFITFKLIRRSNSHLEFLIGNFDDAMTHKILIKFLEIPGIRAGKSPDFDTSCVKSIPYGQY